MRPHEDSVAGEDCRDVLELAINWWYTQLEQVDRATAT
jgi:hypothetical protein